MQNRVDQQLHLLQCVGMMFLLPLGKHLEETTVRGRAIINVFRKAPGLAARNLLQLSSRI